MDVLASDGGWLACGAVSPHSQIVVRVWSFERGEKIGPAFFSRRLERAIRTRAEAQGADPCRALRLVHAESDGMPGLIVDRYGEFLVCQFLSAGAAYWKETIVGELERLCAPKGIYERSDPEVRQKEGLVPSTGVLHGEAPPEWVEIREGPLRFLVDVRKGHKTGFYLDQRENRMCAAGYSRDAEVLDCFSYTGAFGLWCLQGGAAALTQVEASGGALNISRQHLAINGCANARVTCLQADVFEALRELRASGRRFDCVILDPPKFVASRSQLEKGSRGYKDINMLAFRLLRPAGTLFTFSCSGHVSRDLFQKIVADAALDAGRDARILRWLSQAPDHPVGSAFPESLYLKGLLLKVF